MKRSSIAAFTLLELSVVLVIIALVTSMAAVSGISLLATARQSATTQKMAAIDKAMLSFASAYNRIPCPASLTITSGSNYGIEAANQWSCTGGTPAANFSANNSSGTGVAVAEGAVPAVTLGVSTDLMYDGWGNQFRYAVDVSMTKTGMFQMTPVGAKCGSITVADGWGNLRSGNGSSGSVNGYPVGAVYALVSHGSNGHGSYSRYGAIESASSTNSGELYNCHCNSSGTAGTYWPYYVQADSSGNTSGTNIFDDIVTFKERWQMPTPWDRRGVACPYLYFNSPAASKTERFDMGGHDTGAAFPVNTNITTTNGATSGQQFSTVDSSGNIWVADTNDNRLQEFSSSGTWLMTIGGYCGWCNNVAPCTAPASCNQTNSGTGMNLFTNPYSMAFDGSGNMWVADTGNNRADKFSYGGAWFGSVGSGLGVAVSGSGNGLFNTPYGVAVDGSGNVWVADTKNNRISEFTTAGVWLNGIGAGYNSVAGTVGSSGTANGALYLPISVFFDASNNLWVLDNGNSRVQEFNDNGSWMRTIGPTVANAGCTATACATGAGNSQFNRSSGFAIDAMGNVWVMDTGNSRLQEFSSSGVYLGTFASGSSYAGQGSFSESNLPFHGGLVR